MRADAWQAYAIELESQFNCNDPPSDEAPVDPVEDTDDSWLNA